MKASTLYAIMLSVLKENGGSMHPNDLAEEIRRKKLYTQRDGTPLKDGQIHARVSNRPDLFVRLEGMVSINNSLITVVKSKKSTPLVDKEKRNKLKFKEIKEFSLNPLDDWFHESHITKYLVNYLRENEYDIINMAGLHGKGVDVTAKKDGITELIEVKGYPSIYYMNGEKKGLKSKTNPGLQSTHWFSGCLSSTLKNYESKDTQLSMAFPACSKYESLMIKNQKYFTDNNLDIKIYFVDERGNVTVYNLNKALVHDI